ncbi:MAG: helix-turn-helix transcriptional regulator [Clostridia bacterium]|nr:helix-turn-helix transcriptional regulator [Clostridia bacterium]
MIVYKIDVLAALKSAGYSSYRLRKEKIMGESMMQNIREGSMMSWEALSRVCEMLNCQPGDLLEYKPSTDASV